MIIQYDCYSGQHLTYLLLRLELLRVETVEQQGQEQVQHHKVAHDEGRQEDGKARRRAILPLGSHAVPQWFDPLPAQDPEYHHERVEKVVKIPSVITGAERNSLMYVH